MTKVLENILPESMKATKEVIEQRRKQCNSCHFRKAKIGSCGRLIIGQRVVYKGKAYDLCGCVTDEKTVVKNESCEVGKW